jgi:hypothetical protein
MIFPHAPITSPLRTDFRCPPWLLARALPGAHRKKAAIARGLFGLVEEDGLLGCHFFGFVFLPH